MNTLLYTQLAVKCSVGFRFSWNFWGVNQGYNLEGGRHLVSQYLRPISCSRPLNIIMKNEWWEINDRNHSTASSDRLELSSTNGSARPGPYTTLSRMNNRKWHDMLSCYIDECKTGGQMIHKHLNRPSYCRSPCFIIVLSLFAISRVTNTLRFYLSSSPGKVKGPLQHSSTK